MLMMLMVMMMMMTMVENVLVCILCRLAIQLILPPPSLLIPIALAVIIDDQNDDEDYEDDEDDEDDKEDEDDGDKDEDDDNTACVSVRQFPHVSPGIVSPATTCSSLPRWR